MKTAKIGKRRSDTFSSFEIMMIGMDFTKHFGVQKKYKQEVVQLSDTVLFAQIKSSKKTKQRFVISVLICRRNGFRHSSLFTMVLG